MTTLADELLNDFEDSGSENEGKEVLYHGDLPDGDNEPDVEMNTSLAGLDEDAGNELQSDSTVNGAVATPNGRATEDTEEDDAKASIERMQFSGVSDVRSVARLMKTLRPILDVSIIRPL